MSAKIIISFVLVCALIGSLNAIEVAEDPKLCPKICPQIYKPVCGTDGTNFVEFANDCHLKSRNCQAQLYTPTHLDMCRTELVKGVDKLMVKLGNLNLDKPECFTLCNKMYLPACISNGEYRTLVDNPCEMDKINCALGTTQNNFKVISMDEETC